MKYIRRSLLLLFLWILTITTATATDDTLAHKNLLLLGDSYSAHHKLQLEEGWPYQICQRFGMTLYDYAISGSSFAGGENGRYPMVERYSAAMEQDYDIIILQGGSNDWSHNIPLGDVTSRDKTTMLGAMNLMLDDFQTAWPDAIILCFTPWVSTGAKNDLGLDTDDYVAAIADLCESRNLILYDASNAQENGIHMEQESFRAQYSLTSTDRWHLNAAGQTLFADVFSSWLQRELLGIYPSDCFVDMPSAPEETQAAVSLMYEKGIMMGISDTLFAPAQGATRGTLAVTLYRMAGTPAVSGKYFSDVDASISSAVSWVTALGIMDGDGDTFSPNALLHRGELVYALYQYYVGFLGGTVMELTGLGQFSDLDAIPSLQRTAWGWFLGAGFLAPEERLCPDALVSRGQLAGMLCEFLSAK